MIYIDITKYTNYCIILCDSTLFYYDNDISVFN